MSITDEYGGGKVRPGGRMANLLALLVVLLALGGAFGLGLLAGRELGQGSGEDRVWIEEVAEEGSALPAAAAAATIYIIETDKDVPTESGTYVASKTGTKYYRSTCSGAKRIKEENKVWFMSREEAEAAGYEPAANCPGL